MADGANEDGRRTRGARRRCLERRTGTIVVQLAGELDLYNAHDVREALVDCCAEEPERLIVDLSAVSFVDSTTLGVLIEARTRLTNRRGFLLAAPGVETRRALGDLRPRPSLRRARLGRGARAAPLE